MNNNKDQKSNNKPRIRADKSSREAFKITANVSTSSTEIVREVRAGKDVRVS